MLRKLTEYRNALGFEGRSGRNFADWLRSDRESNPQRIENEIAYETEFVRSALRKRIDSIKKRYSDSFENVKRFVDGTDLDAISAKKVIKDIIETAVDAAQTKQHEPEQIEQHEPETIEIKPEPETAHEVEPDHGQDFAIDRIDKNEDMETETIASHQEPETVAEPDRVPDAPNASRLRAYLTNPETMLWGTVAVIFVFLPFTVLNLYQYISIETNSAAGDWGVFLLCCGIAFVWDISILLFAVNGKHQMSKIGAGVLFVFMAAKFDFFKRIVDLIGADGEWWQLMFVLSAIVFYSPILIHQYTKLSVKDEPK